MNTRFAFDTSDGSTVECIPVGEEYELVLRDAFGDTTATVRMSADRALELVDAA